MPHSKPPSVSSETADPSSDGPTVPKAPLQFVEPPQTLREILAKYPLPRVIKCDTKTAPSKDVTRCNLDFTQPLLAYCKRSARKVNAQSVVFDSKTKEFVTVGNNLLIPEDYTGWFAVLGHPDKVIVDQKVPHYRSVSHLSTSRCSQFLVGGTRPIHGIVTEGRHTGLNRQIPCTILPGTVLHKGGLYREQLPPEKAKKKYKKGKEPQLRQFLMCTDDHGREMLVFTGQEGVFYVTAQDGVPVKPPIVQMKVLLERFQLPLLVKLVYGRVPSTPCVFTETLLLTNWGKNHTLVASTLFNYRNVNIEIPIATAMLFQAAENTPGLLGSNAYINALGVCKDQIHTYVRNIKVIFGNPQLEDESTGKTSEDQKESRKKPAGAVANPSTPGSDEATAKGDNATATLRIRTPARTASVVSRTQMADMLKRVTVNGNDDNVFVPSAQPTPPPIRVASKQSDRKSAKSKPPGDEALTVPQDVKRCNMYEPPNPEVIPGKAGHSNPSRPNVSDTGAAKRGAFHGSRHVYDNPTLPRQGSPPSSTSPFGSDSLPENPYYPTWSTEKSPDESSKERQCSTISIPCITGKPQKKGPQVVGPDPSYLVRPVYPSDFAGTASNSQPPADCPTSNSKQGPKVSPKSPRNGSGYQPLAPQLPPVPPLPSPPVLPRRNLSHEGGLDGGADSDSSSLADKESLSETSMDEDNIYINVNFSNLQKVDDHNQSPSGAPPKAYDQLSQPVPKPPKYNDYTVPISTNPSPPGWPKNVPGISDDQDNDGYLIPVHVPYASLDEFGPYSEPDASTLSQSESGPYEEPDDMLLRPSSVTSNAYIDIIDVENRRLPVSRPNNTDSGVYEDEESLGSPKDENANIPSGKSNVPDFMQELSDRFKKETDSLFPKSNSVPCSKQSDSTLSALRPKDSDINLLKMETSSPDSENTKPSIRRECPPLPKRPPKAKSPSTTTSQPKSLGQAVLRSVSNPGIPRACFSQSNKEELIAMLKDAGVSSSTELALRGLQLADITNLLQKENDFDDELIALLPKVGDVDLRKIAMCLRGMKLSI